jgi:flavodoxin
VSIERKAIMTNLVLYDSQFGNTEKIAQAIGRGISGDVQVLPVKDTGNIAWSELKLLVVGSPTQGGRATPMLQKVFETIPANGLQGVRVAAFDTRFDEAKQSFALKLLMKTIAYAAEKIAKTLQAKGGTLAAPPEAFVVTGKEGPLAAGELERAEQWGASLMH